MTIQQLPFGRTGHNSTRIIFGAAALARVSQDVADRALEQLLEHGINHIDVAASYGDAELRVADAVPTLAKRIAHPDGKVAEAAATALGGIKSDESNAALIDL